MRTRGETNRAAIAELIQDGQGRTLEQIATTLQLGKSTVASHLKALREAGALPQPFPANGRDG